MAFFVYALCAVTSLLCFALLLRQNRHASKPLLTSSAMGFLCLAFANALLFVDRIVLGPEIDLSFWRTVVTFVGAVFLLAGLINLRGRDVR